MFVNQSIHRPAGINVFGSHLVRVEPDYATLRCSVTRVEERPAESFAAARTATDGVRAYLAEAGIQPADVRTSQLSLEVAHEGSGAARRRVGYRSRVSFTVLVREFAHLESLLEGLTVAGVNLIDGVSFNTSRLKELRARARTRAIEAARAKAQLYAEAAGVELGPALHIEDVNPDQVRRRGHMPDVDLYAHADDPLETSGQPGSIVVAGSVMVCFEIAGPVRRPADDF